MEYKEYIKAKYAFPSKEVAEEMIRAIDVEVLTLIVLGHQAIYQINEETGESSYLKDTDTYDVDAIWLEQKPEAWEEYRVEPKNPLNVFM
jgi:hypothetical protein